MNEALRVRYRPATQNKFNTSHKALDTGLRAISIPRAAATATVANRKNMNGDAIDPSVVSGKPIGEAVSPPTGETRRGDPVQGAK
jgi:hypothetical protein